MCNLSAFDKSVAYPSSGARQVVANESILSLESHPAIIVFWTSIRRVLYFIVYAEYLEGIRESQVACLNIGGLMLFEATSADFCNALSHIMGHKQ